jgi:hypothetical protein
MTTQEIRNLREEVYALWYHAKDKDKKATYQKVLNLIDHTSELKISLQSVSAVFSGLL